MLRAKSMSDPSPRRSDEHPVEDPTLSRPVESSPDTLPLDTTTKREDVKPSGASSDAYDPLLAPTQIEPSVEASAFAPTVNLPTGVDQTLEFVPSWSGFRSICARVVRYTYRALSYKHLSIQY